MTDLNALYTILKTIFYFIILRFSGSKRGNSERVCYYTRIESLVIAPEVLR